MPNTFIDNRDAWLRLSEIDYLGQFVKVWLAFNAYYRSAYSENQDRKIINELKHNSNPIGNAIRPLLEAESEEAEQLKNDIGLLYNRLENYEIRTGKNEKEQRITFSNVFLRDKPACVEAENFNGTHVTVERNPNNTIHSSVINRKGNQILSVNQQRHNFSELTLDTDYQNLNANQKRLLETVYEKCNPKEFGNLLNASSGLDLITCGSYNFYCCREDLFAAVVEIIYLMRCHLFHGELSPTKQASECYEPAYRIVRKFLECIN